MKKLHLCVWWNASTCKRHGVILNVFIGNSKIKLNVCFGPFLSFMHSRWLCFTSHLHWDQNQQVVVCSVSPQTGGWSFSAEAQWLDQQTTTQRLYRKEMKTVDSPVCLSASSLRLLTQYSPLITSHFDGFASFYVQLIKKSLATWASQQIHTEATWRFLQKHLRHRSIISTCIISTPTFTPALKSEMVSKLTMFLTDPKHPATPASSVWHVSGL